jgi:hypothetical protein
MTHTPGPWRYVKNTGVVTSDECHIGYIGDFKDKELLRFNKDRWEADARLIAAAPELLEALEDVRARGVTDGAGGVTIRMSLDRYAQLHTAIVKARGQSI